MTQHRWIRNFTRAAALAAVLVLPGAGRQAAAAGGAAMTMIVQGELAPAEAVAGLARALEQTGRIAIVARRTANALAHWRALGAASDADLALEEAQFVDYRVRRHGFSAIVRSRADARFAVIVAPGTLVSGLQDLRTRRLAVAAPPSLAALRIHELFPDPGLAPVLVVPPEDVDPVRWVAQGWVDAAVVALERVRAGSGTRVVLLTDALPGPGVSVSPRVDGARRLALIRAFTRLGDSAAGRAALAALAVEAFDGAADADYDGASKLLRGTWPAP